MKAGRQRLDRLLVERGLAESREKAQALVLAGAVKVNGQKAEKAGQAVAEEAQLEVADGPRYVSRGGLKLEAALARFGIRPEGKVCLDVGSSTGGFTDCLLQHGARRVYCVDVGAGQLDWRLRNDSRVEVRERVNARYLDAAIIPERVDLLVCDLSFISVTLVLAAVTALLQDDGEMVILVKPQFEAGKGRVGRGGIVREPELHAAACAKVAGAVREHGFQTALMDSPILGAEGNREFLLHGWRTHDRADH